MQAETTTIATESLSQQAQHYDNNVLFTEWEPTHQQASSFLRLRGQYAGKNAVAKLKRIITQDGLGMLEAIFAYSIIAGNIPRNFHEGLVRDMVQYLQLKFQLFFDQQWFPQFHDGTTIAQAAQLIYKDDADESLSVLHNMIFPDGTGMDFEHLEHISPPPKQLPKKLRSFYDSEPQSANVPEQANSCSNADIMRNIENLAQSMQHMFKTQKHDFESILHGQREDIQVLQSQQQAMRKDHTDVQQQVDNQRQLVQDLQSHNAMIEKDGRKLLIIDDILISMYESSGADKVHKLLLQWYDSYMSKFGNCICLRQNLQFARIYVSKFTARKRIEVVVDCKSVRDELCKRLRQSPLRKLSYKNVDIKCCLTALQRRNRDAIFEAFKGRQHVVFSYAADWLELWPNDNTGKKAFRFNLALTPEQIAQQICKAKAFVEGPADVHQSTQALKAQGEEIWYWNCCGATDLKLQLVKCAFSTTVPLAMGLVETHAAIDISQLHMFDKNTLLQVNRAHAEGQRFGGLALVFKPGVKVVDHRTSEYNIMALCKIGQQYLILNLVYIPPANSAYVTTAYHDILENMLAQQQALQLANGTGNCRIIYVGDFNAHVAMHDCNKHLVQKSIDREYAIQQTRDVLCNRYSLCQASVNARGRALERFTNTANIFMLNGRCKSDSTGQCTYTCTVGGAKHNTVVDFVLTNMIADIDMRVEQDYQFDSGHAAIRIWVNVSVMVRCNANMQHDHIQGQQRAKQLVLTSQETNQFRKHNFQALLANMQQMVAKNDDIDSTTLAQVLDSTITETILALHPQPRQRSHKQQQGVVNPQQAAKTKQPWFDARCALEQQQLKLVQRRCGKDSDAFANQLKKYHTTLKQARMSFIQQIDQIRINRPREFFQLLKAQNTRPVPKLQDFQKYFTDLFVFDDGIENIALPSHVANVHVPEVTLAEIDVALSQIGNHKSAANSAWSLDLLKGHDSNVLLECVRVLFNQVNKSGVPHDWRELLLAPLFKNKGSIEDCKNYRAIALISPLAKLYTKLVLNRLSNLPYINSMHAYCQSGFRAEHRLEDNCIMLQALMQHATKCKHQLFIAFIDLEKAYDRVPRQRLFNLMCDELGIDAPIVKQLAALYNSVRARVVIDGRLSEPLHMHNGVKQGCPASPELFSLYMDQLENFIMNSVSKGDVERTDAIRVAGLLVPLLLFADDMVLCARTVRGLNALLQVLADFCDQSGLVVSLEKTVCMQVGSQSANMPLPIEYKGHVLKSVKEFKYLGLMFNTQGSTQHMAYARIVKAKQQFNWLISTCLSKGWRDLRTVLTLYNVYVKSIMLFGSVVWGQSFVHGDAPLSVDRLGKLGSLHRRNLRAILGSSPALRNELVYLFACQTPLHVDIVKNVARYYNSNSLHKRMVGRFFKWGQQLDHVGSKMNLQFIQQVGSTCGDITQFYKQWLVGFSLSVKCIERLHGTIMAATLSDLVPLAFGKGGSMHLSPPQGMTMKQYLSVCGRCKVAYDSKHQAHRTAAQPSWLAMHHGQLSKLLSFIYLDVSPSNVQRISEGWKALATHIYWEKREHRVFSMFVQSNGLALALWCGSFYIVEMLSIKLG